MIDLSVPNVCYYEWYRGSVGDSARSQLLNPAAGWSNSATVCNVTSPTTVWVRVYGLDYDRGDPANDWTCYTDSPAATVNP